MLGFLPEPWMFVAGGVALLAGAAAVAYFIADLRLALYIGAGAGVLFLCAAVAHEYEARGKHKIQVAWDADKAMRIKRTTEITLLMNGLVNKAQNDAAAREGELNARYATLQSQLARVPAGGRVTVSGASSGLYDDAVRAANSARPDASGQEGTKTIPTPAQPQGSVVYDEREFAAWVLSAGAAYADAYNLWRACRDREDGYLTALAKGTAP